jgi:predicted house-cleaning noncanonical NTP pyrophosphatase (MazG superfamily)
MTRHGEFVRDLVPEAFRTRGRHGVVRSLEGDELLAALRAKLDEELAGYGAAEDDAYAAEELADNIEVDLALGRRRGCPEARLQEIRVARALSRSSFDRRFYLVETQRRPAATGRAGTEPRRRANSVGSRSYPLPDWGHGRHLLGTQQGEWDARVRLRLSSRQVQRQRR